jgi:hypothetical protein
VTEGLDVAMPARATALLSADFHVWSRDAPFAGMNVRPTFTFTDRMFGPTGVTGTIGTDLAIRPPAPRLRGPTGVRLTVRTRPRTPLFNPRRAPRVEPGRAIRIFGTTDPVLRREAISLRVLVHGADREPRRLARVRTDRRGRFRHVWRPRRAGIHELFAYYEPQRRGVTADRTCPRFLRVGRGR